MQHSNLPEAQSKNALRMRRVLTAAELKFWNAVRAHRLMGIGFRRQMPIAGYIVDFACPEHRLIIEMDGPSHSYDQNIARDIRRDERLAASGWQVVRVTNDEALPHIVDVCYHLLRDRKGVM